MAQSMTPAECHSLAIYFSLRAVRTGRGSTDMEAILAWKLLASGAFRLPTTAWESEMQKYTPTIPPKVRRCQCRCGCPNQAVSLQWCMGRVLPECKLGNQRLAVCTECLHYSGSCHVCMLAPKNEEVHVPPEPAKPEYPISWYFNSPNDMPWVTKIRNTSWTHPLS